MKHHRFDTVYVFGPPKQVQYTWGRKQKKQKEKEQLQGTNQTL